MIYRVIDFETTGIQPGSEVVEAAYVDVLQNGEFGDEWSSLVTTRVPVSPEARAAHHITDEDIQLHGVAWGAVRAVLEGGRYQNARPFAFVAHNADFERGFFNPGWSRWIDTHKCALRIWPGAPKHNAQVLRYWVGGADPGDKGMPPHRALPDCYVTAYLFRLMIASGADNLFAWSSEPPVLPRVPFGKHFGKFWADVPTDYPQWMQTQEFDEGVRHTVNLELERRRGG